MVEKRRKEWEEGRVKETSLFGLKSPPPDRAVYSTSPYSLTFMREERGEEGKARYWWFCIKIDGF